MKKLIPLFACLALFSCAKESGLKPERLVQTRIHTWAPDVLQKTFLAPDGKGGLSANWNADDCLGVFSGTVAGEPASLSNTEPSGASAIFEGSIKAAPGQTTLFSFYPHDAFSSVADNGRVKLILPYLQQPVKNSFDPDADILIAAPYGVSIPDEGELAIEDMRFARIMAVLRVVLKDETSTSLLTGQTVRSIKLSSSSEALSGTAVVDLSDAGIFAWETGENSVEADCSGYDQKFDGESAVYLVVRPCVLACGSTLTIDVQTKDYILRKQVTLTSDMPLVEAANSTNTVNVSFSDENIEETDKDTHAPGFVFFSDDFQWIIPLYENTKYTKYGWVAEKLDGTNYNEYALSADTNTAQAFKDRGYEFDAASTYVKYEGWVRLGKSGSTGMLRLPVLSGIDAGRKAEVALTFDTAIYFALVNTPDEKCQIKVFVDGPGEIASTGTAGCAPSQGGKSIVIPIDSDAAHKWVFTRKQLIIKGATSSTRLRFDDSEAIQARAFLDNVTVTRVAEGTVAASDQLAPLPALEATQSSTGYKNKASSESTNTPDVRVNRPWTAESTVGWLTLSGAQSGSKKYSAPSPGVIVSADNMKVDVPGTGFPYKLSITTNENTSSSLRTGHVLVKVGGETVLSFEISQKGCETEEKVSTQVFLGATDDHIYYRIPALVQASNGNILAFCEARTTQTYSDNQSYDFYTGNESMFTVTPDNASGSGDRGNIDLVMKMSHDGGKTWGDMITIVDDRRNTCGNPVPVVDDKGTVHLFFCWQSWPISNGYGSDLVPEKPGTTSATTRRIFYTRSVDNGATWSAPKDMTSLLKDSSWGWVATGPGHGIQLKSGAHAGRICIPVNYKPDAAGSTTDTYATCFWSDDYGATWNVGGSTQEGANESQLVELKDGKLMSSFRYRGGGYRYYAISEDGGASWSNTVCTNVIDPGCQGSTAAYMPSGTPSDNILMTNCNASSRKNLYFSVSCDGGANWTAKKQVVTSGASAYSDLLVGQDGSVSVLYECDSDKFTQTAPYERIRFQRWPASMINSTFGF